MMQLVEGLIVMLIGYIFGCFQTAYIIGKSVGKMDIRDKGSGNAGASNVTMVLGWKFGILTATVDVLKGLLPVLIVKTLYPATPALAFLAGLSAILGHMFPFYLRFRGGKGVATLLGLLLGYDVRWGLIFTLTMIVLPLVFDYVVIGSLTVFAGLPVLTYGLSLAPVCLWFALILTVIAYAKHMENLRHIRSGEEVHVSDAMKRRKE